MQKKGHEFLIEKRSSIGKNNNTVEIVKEFSSISNQYCGQEKNHRKTYPAT